MFIFSSVVYGEKVSAPLFHIILVTAREMSVFQFTIYKGFAFSLLCMLALSLYVFLVHKSWIDTWNCVCFTGPVSLIVFHCKGDPMFVIHSAFFQCHYWERSAPSVPLMALRFRDLLGSKGSGRRAECESTVFTIYLVAPQQSVFQQSSVTVHTNSGLPGPLLSGVPQTQ